MIRSTWSSTLKKAKNIGLDQWFQKQDEQTPGGAKRQGGSRSVLRVQPSDSVVRLMTTEVNLDH
jgi:hypothetical protein